MSRQRWKGFCPECNRFVGLSSVYSGTGQTRNHLPPPGVTSKREGKRGWCHGGRTKALKPPTGEVFKEAL